MEKTREFLVKRSCSGMTVFFFLRRVLPKNRVPVVEELLQGGFVEVNGEISPPEAELRYGDYVVVNAEALEELGRPVRAQGIEILYRDEALLCVNKPAGLSVIPDRRQKGKTAVQVCREMLEGEGLNPRPVHRLDKWTSGILLLALRKRYVEVLGNLFSERRVDKSYLAYVRGRPDPPDGVVDEPIGPNAKRMTRIVVGSRMAKEAVTRFMTLKTWEGVSLLEVKPETGRTHQIRVHLSHIGHPILCDALYGGGDSIRLSEFKLDYKLGRGKKEKPLLRRQALHAARIALESPGTGRRISVDAPLPHDLDVLEKKLDRYASPPD